MNDKEIRIGTVHRMPRVLSDGLVFLLVLRGSVFLEHDRTSYQLSDGGVAVINDGDFFSLNSEEPNVLLLLRFPQKYLSDRFESFSLYRFSCICCSQGNGNHSIFDPLKKMVAELAFLGLKKTPESQLQFQSVLFKTLHLLITEFLVQEQEQIEPNEDKRLKLAIEYIHQNYKSRIRQGDVAQHVFLSPQYLSRLFKNSMNTTFLEYVGSLRLSSAKYDLLHSKDTVTKIAMSNGFANDKTMSIAFTSEYGMTPNEYRKAYQPKSQEAAEAYSTSFIDEKQDNVLEVLVRFIDSFKREQRRPPDLVHRFSLSEGTSFPRPRFSVIADIGDIRQALRADRREQLAVAKQDLAVEYIAFDGLLTAIEEAQQIGTPFPLYDVFDVLDRIQKKEMVPFVRIDMNGFDMEQLDKLISILNTLHLRYGTSRLSKWHFEAVGDMVALREFFSALSTAIHNQVPAAKVGTRILVEVDGTVPEMMVLEELSACQIDFLSVSADPNLEYFPLESTTYEELQSGFHLRQIQKVKEMAEAIGKKDIPFYLTDWNTLTGNSTVEAGEFHRTALVADTLRRLSGFVSGVSIRLSLDDREAARYGILTYPLSLFLYRTIRRPFYFVLKAFVHLNEFIVAQGDGYLLTRDSLGNIVLLLYNACYINPFLALDNIRGGSYSKTISCSLTNLTAGNYRVKKYLMDKENGSVYQSWVKLDLFSPLDAEDLDEYLETISNPSMVLYEESVTDKIQINQELSMNATALYIIKRYHRME